MSICSILPTILDPHGSESYIYIYIYALFTLYSHGIPTVTYHFLRSILYLHSSHYCHDIFPPKKIFRNSHYSPSHCHDPILFPPFSIHYLMKYHHYYQDPFPLYPLYHHYITMIIICSTFFPSFLSRSPTHHQRPPTPRLRPSSACAASAADGSDPRSPDPAAGPPRPRRQRARLGAKRWYKMMDRCSMQCIIHHGDIMYYIYIYSVYQTRGSEVI